jgi:hypothetical protein
MRVVSPTALAIPAGFPAPQALRALGVLAAEFERARALRLA